MTLADQVPYPSQTVDQTHPARLEALARLLGMAPRPARGARVLELGCGDGTNLLSLAQLLPGATLLGVDLSGEAIARGRQRAAALGLQVELRHGDLAAVELSGEWDLVVAHGVWSWVPHHVQEALLRHAAAHLAPHGLLYLSYNALPGWSAGQSLRRSLLPAVDAVADPLERVRLARVLMRALAATAPASAWGGLLRNEIRLQEALPDWFLAHDLLAPHNTPIHGDALVARARTHGLRPLAEAEPAHGGVDDLTDDQAALVRALPAGARYATLDLLRFRRFRATLWCRAGVPPRGDLDPAVLPGLHASVLRAPLQPAAPSSPRPQLYDTATGELAVVHPVAKACLAALDQGRPASLPVARLRAALGPSLDAHLLDLYAAGVVSLATLPAPLRPRGTVASPLARAQVGWGVPFVSTLAHTSVELGESARQVLVRLDGRPLADVARELPGLPLLRQLDALGRAGLLA